jgi:hypothetical protein
MALGTVHKGGKTMFDALPKTVSAAVMRYLHAAYGDALPSLPGDASVDGPRHRA